MKKIVSFDLDGTIVNGQFGEMVWNHGIPEEFSKKYSIAFEEAKRLIIKEYEAIGDTNILWYNIEYWLNRFNLPIAADTLLNRYEAYIELLPDVKEVLETLKGKYTLIIASNAARIFVEKELYHMGAAHYFSHIISATTDYKMVKKGEGFYKKLCNTLNVSPEELIHVGDHPIFDFVAPSSVGIESYLLRSLEQGAGSWESGVERREQGAGSRELSENNGRVITSLMELLHKL
jgi:putative hydrolase of the HAD superfamily